MVETFNREVINELPPLLELKDVKKSFGGLKAIKGVSLQVYPGEILGLIGPNGAGKTTLFNLISGFLKVDAGDIIFDNQSIKNFKPNHICKLGLGRTFQIPKPLGNLTVLDNLMVGALLRSNSSSEAQTKALAIAEELNLINKIKQLAGDLSVTEKKRLGFGQALATEAKLLLLDEIASGIIPTEVDQLLIMIKNAAAAQITIIMVEHVMRAVMSVSSRIAVLDQGLLIAQGTPQEITNNDDVIEAYLGTQYHQAQRGQK